MSTMKTEKSTLERLNAILADQLGLEPGIDFDEKSRLREDLGADSLDTVEILMACEEEWSHDVSEEEEEKIEQCATVGDVVKLIDEITAQ